MKALDIVNSVFEAGGAVAAWKNALQLQRDKQIKGVYWPVYVFYSAWGLWNLVYYPGLGQWLSFGAGVLLVTGNIAWVVLAIRFRRNRRKAAAAAVAGAPDRE